MEEETKSPSFELVPVSFQGEKGKLVDVQAEEFEKDFELPKTTVIPTENPALKSLSEKFGIEKDKKQVRIPEIKTLKEQLEDIEAQLNILSGKKVGDIKALKVDQKLDKIYVPPTEISYTDLVKNGLKYENPERYLVLPLMPYVVDIVNIDIKVMMNNIDSDFYQENKNKYNSQFLLFLEASKQNQINFKKDNVIPRVRIGSLAWLDVIQLMTTSPIYTWKDLNEYFEYCATVLEQALPFRVHDSDGNNKIYEFGYWYYYTIDPEKRNEKVKNEYDRLINDIRSKSITASSFDNPFIPENYEPGVLYTKENLGGPKKVTVKIGNKTLENFLEYFTDYTRENSSEGKIMNFAISGVPEVRPPKGMTQWVPEKYRDHVYQYYDLYEYKWLEPETFSRYYAILVFYGSNTNIEDVWIWRNNNKTPHLLINDSKKQNFWNISNAVIEIPDRKWKQIGLTTKLNEWEGIGNLLYGYPNYNITPQQQQENFAFYKYMLNVQPYLDVISQEEQDLYVLKMNYQGRIYYRFRENVPMRLYQTSLVYNFGPYLRLKEDQRPKTPEQRKESFIRSFWEFIKFHDTNRELAKSVNMPKRYAELLTIIYEMGPSSAVISKEVFEEYKINPEMQIPTLPEDSNIDQINEYIKQLYGIEQQLKTESVKTERIGKRGILDEPQVTISEQQRLKEDKPFAMEVQPLKGLSSSDIEKYRRIVDRYITAAERTDNPFEGNVDDLVNIFKRLEQQFEQGFDTTDEETEIKQQISKLQELENK